MRLIPLLAATAAAALMAGAASAQTTGDDMTTGQGGNAQAGATTTTAAPQAATQAGAPVSMATDMPAIDQAKAGDPGVVSNSPIPDTPENRAKYGQPMSNAGRHTAPAGN